MRCFLCYVPDAVCTQALCETIADYGQVLLWNAPAGCWQLTARLRHELTARHFAIIEYLTSWSGGLPRGRFGKSMWIQ